MFDLLNKDNVNIVFDANAKEDYTTNPNLNNRAMLLLKMNFILIIILIPIKTKNQMINSIQFLIEKIFINKDAS